MSKTFEGDFYKFLNMIKINKPFTLNRWGDGELMLLENKNINLLNKGNGEFDNKCDDITYESSRSLLRKSFTFRDKNYYVGIACKCCVGEEKYDYMKKISTQDEDHLTWANIFVNSNYKLFLNEFIPTLNQKNVVLISHRDSDITNMPFDIVNHYKVPSNAWINDYGVVDEIISFINEMNIRDHIFLFASGPHANIATYKCHVNNSSNTYIDIGSVFDKMLGLKATRKYLNNGSTLNKVCIW